MLTFPLQSRFSFEIVDCVNVGEARMAEWEASENGMVGVQGMHVWN